MPWEKQYDRTEVVERAMQAFWAKGYEGTSVGDLVAATGINRGSLYTAYDGKRSLFIAALRHYDRHHRSDFLERLGCEHRPKDAIIAVFDAAARGTGRDGRPAGCLLVNTALELSPHDPEIGALVQASFDEVELFFCSMLERARRDGTIRNAMPARKCAKALLGLFLGLRVLARSNADSSTLNAIAFQARTMMD